MLSVVNEEGTTEAGSLIAEIVRDSPGRWSSSSSSPPGRDGARSTRLTWFLARAGARFEKGVLVEREEVSAA
ncbi:hypothetical protein [Streptomyces sp. DT224]|uniref:hypothetical protein n=1 Tax=Streptomyces sp. DT224 TaxID=3393426 RepID=UPI003CF7FDF0